jgi:TRAP-type mannitol/chloroaromatic compound transport system permease small subunit
VSIDVKVLETFKRFPFETKLVRLFLTKNWLQIKEERSMNEFIQEFWQTLWGYLPSALGAIGIIVGGWLLALIGSAITRRVIKRTTIDERIAALIRAEEELEAGRVDVERWAGKVVYYLIMLFVVIGFLQALNLTAVAEPINQFLNQVLSYLPMLLGAGVLLLAAWVVASALKFAIVRALRATKLEERLTSQADLEAPEQYEMSTTLGKVVYWLVFLLFLPAVLGALGLHGLLEPVQGMVGEILGVLPNILGAGLILLVGWVGSRIVRQIITNLLTGVGLDRLGEQTGIEAALGGQRLSTVIGTIVYVLILIPIVISALNALQIEAVSEPASQMLGTILNALPAIFGALLLVGIAYFVAKLVGAFITNFLTGIGFDKVLSWIGLASEAVEGRRTPSEIVGYLAIVGIMFFAVIEAANLLGFTILAELVSQLLIAAGGVLLGLVIFGLGLYLAGLAESVIRDAGGSQAHVLAPSARVAIIVFAGALGLRQTGIAEDIVNLTFGIVLGAIAVATALAFGLGARDIAARELERWLQSFRGSKRT